VIALRTQMHGVAIRLSSLERERLQTGYARLNALELRPVIDELRCALLADCCSCWASLQDPERTWRPLTIHCGAEHPTPRLDCAAGCTHHAVIEAMKNPSAPLHAVEETLRAERDRWASLARGLLDVTGDLSEPAAPILADQAVTDRDARLPLPDVDRHLRTVAA
jgi:hypothetical protein